MQLVKFVSRDIPELLPLVQQLNPKTSRLVLQQRFEEMFTYPNYHCFGLITQAEIVGITGGWITTRLYCGRQLELDNVVMRNDIQSKGYGTKLLALVEAWARENGCSTIELNTYTTNARSHKFYFNSFFTILGFHFQKN